MNEHHIGMRVVSALLWFLAGAAIGNSLAIHAGAPAALVPLLGAWLAILVAGDPFHLLWKPKRQPTRALDVDTTQA